VTLPKSVAALNRCFPDLLFVRNKDGKRSHKKMRVVNRVDKSVTYCDAIMVIDVPWYYVERGVPILSSDDLICAVAFNRYTIKDSFHYFLLRNNITSIFVL
jgi:hypothetical protein